MPEHSDFDPRTSRKRDALENRTAIYKFLLLLTVPMLVLLTIAVFLAISDARRHQAEAEAAKHKADVAWQAVAAAQEDANALVRSARKRLAETQEKLRRAEAGLAQLDEAPRRRSMATHARQNRLRKPRQPTTTQRDRTPPDGKPSWTEAQNARALKAHELAAKLSAKATGHVKRKEWTQAEDALLETLAQLEDSRPVGSDWLTTRTRSWRWRVLTLLRSIYAPEALDRPIHQTITEILVRRPTLNGAHALRGAPALIPASTLAGAGTTLCLSGPAGEFRVADVVGDVSVAPMGGTMPVVLRVSAEGAGLHPFAFNVDAGAKTFTATGVLLVADWTVRFFKGQPGQGGSDEGEDTKGLIRGDPVAEVKTNALDFTWWGNAPAAGVPADRFSTVATTTVPLHAGRYKLWTSADDGVRVWINGERVIDDWRWRPPRENTTTVDLEGGEHALRVEHYETTKHAQLHFGMEQLR